MTYTRTKGIITEEKAMRIDLSKIISIFTIIWLINIIVLFSVLNADMLIKIKNGNQPTIVYSGKTAEEEITVVYTEKADVEEQSGLTISL